MTKTQQARELMAQSEYSMSESTVLRRLANGWSHDRVINTRVERKPPRSHPMKAQCYGTIANRKGWKV